MGDTLAAVLRARAGLGRAARHRARGGAHADPPMSGEGWPAAHRGHLGRAVRPRRPRGCCASHCARQFRDGRSTTTAVAPHGDTFRHVARRRRDGRQRCLVRGALHRAAPRVAPPHHAAERGGDIRRAGTDTAWPSRLMARASSTSAPTARHSSCAPSISSTPRRSPGSACRMGRSSRRTASGSASSRSHRAEEGRNHRRPGGHARSPRRHRPRCELGP